MQSVSPAVPLPVRLKLGRAAVQTVADHLGVDVLHIKGHAVDPALRPVEASGSDVDVLVRPGHVAALDRALRARGWRLYSSFEYGSPFGHAQTYLHDSWGYLDLHRSFPGFRAAPGEVFSRLWADRRHLEVAGVGCHVPSVAAQATILVLNAARAGGTDASTVAAVWHRAPAEQRAQVQELVDELKAPVAFAAAVGDLDRYRGAPDYLLWKVASQGGSRLQEWWGRIRAAPSVSDAVRVALRAPRVNVEQLAHELGRQPTRREITAAFVARQVHALRDLPRFLHPRGGA